MYFKKANKLFAEAKVSFEDLPTALKVWEKWHWDRIAFEFLAFVCAIATLLKI